MGYLGSVGTFSLGVFCGGGHVVVTRRLDWAGHPRWLTHMAGSWWWLLIASSARAVAWISCVGLRPFNVIEFFRIGTLGSQRECRCQAVLRNPVRSCQGFPEHHFLRFLEHHFSHYTDQANQEGPVRVKGRELRSLLFLQYYDVGVE